MVRIEKTIFSNKQSIPWKDVYTYSKKYEGCTFVNRIYGDRIVFNYISASEYASSSYSKKLRGAYAKVKANLVQVLPKLIESASNRRWIENKADKHYRDASKGWYRYDVFFEMPVKSPNDQEIHWNRYSGTLVVRLNDMGMFFYDVINIKKETSTPGES